MKHDIIVKFTPEAKEGDYPKFLTDIVMLFSGSNLIPGVHEIHYYPNIVHRPNRYDLMIEIDMEEEALTEWDSSEIHRRWKDEYGKFVEKKAIIDRM